MPDKVREIFSLYYTNNFMNNITNYLQLSYNNYHITNTTTTHGTSISALEPDLWESTQERVEIWWSTL